MRQRVYDKYDGHCAYCGREIKMSEMQVDHIIPIAHSILGQLDHTCRQSFQVRLAMQYGIIRYEPWDGKFYFERNKQ